MGGGRWSTDRYEAEAAYRRARGLETFAYDDQTRRLDPGMWRAAPALDPFGVSVREARDSAEHPSSTPIAVLFDVTGSMQRVPRQLQERLPDLLGLLNEGRYVSDPQIMFGAIGDADSDRVPLQVAQFESDNRMDEQLRQIFLEGGGGGQKSESYELAAWFMAHKVSADAIERRGRKGYLFIIGDEMNKPVLKARHLREVLGVEVTQDVDVRTLYAELQRTWNVYFVLPRLTAYWDDREVADHWRELLGQRFLRLEDPASVCELIAVTIGMEDGYVDLRQGRDDVRRVPGLRTPGVRAFGPEAEEGYWDSFRAEPARPAPSSGLRRLWNRRVN